MSLQGRLTTAISTKGQVILPKAIRLRRGWEAGARLTVEDTPDGVLLKASPVFPRSRIDSAYGSMRRSGPALSVDDMRATVVREAKRRARD